MGKYYRISLAFIIYLSFCCFLSESAHVSHDGRALTIDGERKIIFSGSIHYPRSTAQMWPSLIKKAKEGGLNTIETYVFWNAHEPVRRQYDFTGNLDIVKFVKTIQDAGLHAILRIGPYVCAEWNYGGFPVWLHSMSKDIAFRTTNEIYMEEMKTFTSKIVDMMKKEKLFASDGGPIILAQIENEYGDMEHRYGDDKPYVTAVANFAESLKIGVPWIMCQQQDAPYPIIETCNGMYCDNYYPQNRSMPKMWTELWTGWFKTWGDSDPHRPAEDVAFAVTRFFQKTGTLLNYYMYHGGTNFGRTSGGPHITTSYDYDAPLNEYGLPNQPKWGHLKQLHEVLLSIENFLTHGDFVTTQDHYTWMFETTVVSLDGKRICFFANGDNKDYTFHFEGQDFTIIPWSVGIYLDCRTEIFNTARVNVTREVLEFNKQQGPLEWTWRPERIEEFKDQSAKQKSVTFAPQLLEQKSVTNDTSDYLWYMVSLDVDDCSSPVGEGNVTLKVHSAGQVLHAFFNKKHIGTEWNKDGLQSIDLKGAGKLKPGKNTISLLSATVGLPNYGSNGLHYENINFGVLGPATLTTSDGQHLDLTDAQWGYEVGVSGMNERQFFSDKERRNWKTNLQVNKPLVWYKATFDTPPGDDPVAVDLEGLGKGTAWVNGNNLGRYWTSIRTPDSGCGSCDYRGTYGMGDPKCRTSCGQPAQKYYHVPRSFLNKSGKKNDLVLFEEFGGDPSKVNVRTVTPEKA